jgi:predicted DNA-binding protein with PD1-like motif
VAKIFSLRKGARIPEDILKIARREKIATARVEAIGGVNRLRLAYYNSQKKKYEEHEYRGFFEVTSLLGNITTKDGKPFLHVHGTFGKRDMSVVGGHVMTATVFPILEVVITPTKNKALRKFDETTGLNVIHKIS